MADQLRNEEEQRQHEEERRSKRTKEGENEGAKERRSVEVEMASLPDSSLNGEEKRKEEEIEDAESFSRAPFWMALQEAGEGAKLCAKDIASKICCSNPEGASMLDRLLALLSSHSIFNSSLISV
ncbi:hypothetical protein VNO80_21778 [Phaseolus coccineus]|uniref:Uncharacterized protein n=1 Tax=Phaseolus coccineus TaxID=3886 RepID=A0AAN9M3N8_PHACN